MRFLGRGKPAADQVQEGPGRPKGATKSVTIVKKIEGLIEKYGEDNIELLFKKGFEALQQGQQGGIKFDITITKGDLADKELMETVSNLISVSQGRPAQAAQATMPKELEKAQGLLQGLAQMGLGGMAGNRQQQELGR